MIKKKNAGMTLVEIMVTLAITAMVLTVLGSIYLSTTEYFGFFSEKRESQMVIQTLFDEVEKRVVYATDIYISYEPMDKEGYTITCISSYKQEKSAAPQPGRMYDFNSKEEESYIDNYGEFFYENGLLKCSVENTTTTSLTVKMAMYNTDSELLYERTRTFDIINMSGDAATSTIKVSSGLSKQTYSNEDKDLYIYTHAVKKIIQPSPLGSELLIWRDMQKIFTDTCAENPTHYSNYTKGAQVPIRYANALLGYEYLQSKGLNEWPAISNEILDTWGLSGKMRKPQYFMLPYHYVENLKECDVLYYAVDSSLYDISADGVCVNLVFLQEENAWYYFELNDVNAGSKCTSLKLWEEETDSYRNIQGFPLKEGSILQYTDDAGNEYNTSISSSYECKTFIKKYGHLVAKENEVVR